MFHSIKVFFFSCMLLNIIPLNFQVIYFIFVSWQGVSQKKTALTLDIVINEEIDLGKLKIFMEIILWIKILSSYTFKMYLCREIVD